MNAFIPTSLLCFKISPQEILLNIINIILKHKKTWKIGDAYSAIKQFTYLKKLIHVYRRSKKKKIKA